MATSPRPCAECGRHLPRKAHPNRRYCEKCRPRKPKKDDEPTPVGEVARGLIGRLRAVPDIDQADDEPVTMESATEKAITAAADYLTPKDDGAVEVLRFLARKLDTEDQLRKKILDSATEAGERLELPAYDNTLLPTYLNYANALGLTPAGRARLSKNTAADENPKRSKLSALRDSAKKGS